MIRIYDQTDEDELAVACLQWNERWFDQVDDQCDQRRWLFSIFHVFPSE